MLPQGWVLNGTLLVWIRVLILEYDHLNGWTLAQTTQHERGFSESETKES